MVTGRLDHDAFLALSKARSPWPRCSASSVARKALAFATALATRGESPATAREKYTENASSPTHTRAGASRMARFRPAGLCRFSGNPFVLMVILRFGCDLFRTPLSSE